MLSSFALKSLVCVLLLSAAAQAKEHDHSGEHEKHENHVKPMHPIAEVEPERHQVVVDPKPVEMPKPAEEPKVEVPKVIEEAKNKIASAMQGLPPFIQSIFDTSRDKIADADAQIEQKFNDMISQQKGNGFFSILLLKKKTQPAGEPEPESFDSEPKKSLILFKISPKKEIDDEAPFNNLHLLGGGGHDDVDNKWFQFNEAQKQQQAQQQDHLLGGDDLDRIHNQMTGNGGEDVFRGPEPQVLIPQVPFFNYFQNGKRPYLIPKEDRKPADSSEESSEEDSDRPVQSLIIRNDFLDRPPMSSSESVKKCMMQHFLRLKASLYYRTVLHMLFISGVLLFIMLVFMIVMRTCQRRRAMRQRFRNMMNVSAIESKLHMANAPPAYEQLVTEKKPFPPPGEQSSVTRNFRASGSPSTLVHSLAQAYRSRYNALTNEKPTEADNVSVSSLPNYEEHAAKGKNEQI